MKRLVVAAVLALAVPTAPALACADPVMRPCEAQGITKKRKRDGHFRSNSATVRIAKPFIRGRLVCAKNVNAELARRGIQGTGSAQAKSFLRWGRASRPVPGAVAVYARRGGGHVAIISRIERGRVYVLNPSARLQRWVETVYPRAALAYRVAD